MNEKGRKHSFRKAGKEIEFSLGDAGPTKNDIMRSIAKHNTIYGATVWLNTPLPDHKGQTPAELMLAGELETVASLVKKLEDERNAK